MTNPLLKYAPLFQAPDTPNTSPAPGSTPQTSTTPPSGETAPPKPAEGAPPSLASGTPAAEAPKAEAEAPKPGEAPKPEAAPAALDIAKLQLPEGLKADDPLIAQFGTILSDEKLAPQERAQQLINMHTSAVQKAADAPSEYWKGVREGWVNEVKADPQIGGSKLEPTLQGISKMIDTLGPAESKGFREALDMSGIGDNPAVIRALASWSKLLVEGGHINGTPPGQAQAVDLAKTFFPNSNMKG